MLVYEQVLAMYNVSISFLMSFVFSTICQVMRQLLNKLNSQCVYMAMCSAVLLLANMQLGSGYFHTIQDNLSCRHEMLSGTE